MKSLFENPIETGSKQIASYHEAIKQQMEQHFQERESKGWGLYVDRLSQRFNKAWDQIKNENSEAVSK